MDSLRIKIRDGYDYDGSQTRPFYPVVVIGAGVSGIAVGYQLKQKYGIDQFRIFDRESGIGGTWWVNRYPGVACDVKAERDRATFLYSFSFAPNYTGKTIFPSGRDYVDYLYNIAERGGIMDKIQLNTEVKQAEWIEEESEWELRIIHRATADGHDVAKTMEIIRAKVVISAVGILSEPKDWPEHIKGRDSFTGQLIYPARWPAESNLEGKDIVLVGSGCSAAQIAPALLKTNIKSLTQIMRSPPWLHPRLEEPGGREAYAKWAPRIFSWLPFLGFMLRIGTCWGAELFWMLIFKKTIMSRREKQQILALQHVRSLAPQEYHSMLTPQYSMGCKRRVYDNDWLRSMSNPRFRLVKGSWAGAEGESVFVDVEKSPVAGPEKTEVYHADALILALGFQATQFLQPVTVIGRNGISLHDLWDARGGAHAYMGASVDGFPNFFMIAGPNTEVGHTSAMLPVENGIEYILRMIHPILTGHIETLEPSAAAVQTWLNDIRRDMKNTVFESCHSWYNGDGAYNSVMYPRSQLDYYLRCKFPRNSDWHRTLSKKGQRQRMRRRFFAVLLGAITLAACYKIGIHDGAGGQYAAMAADFLSPKLQRAKGLVYRVTTTIKNLVAQAAK